MNKTQAAKLAQAYGWLGASNKVQGRFVRENQPCDWRDWDGTVIYDEFRLKPEPAKLLECWVNITKDGICHIYNSKRGAEVCTAPLYIRTAVPLREVSEPDIQGMVTRFLNWRLPDDFFPDGGISFKHITDPQWTHDSWPTGTNLFHAGQAEVMIRHILGDAT